MKKLHPVRLYKAFPTIMFVVAIFALAFWGSGTQVALAQAGGGKLNSSSTPKPLISHPNHYYKHVCDRTNKPGTVHCDADIVTDAKGNILSSPLSSPDTLLTGAYGPAAFRVAYGVTGTTSTTRTVAIVDAYNDPTVLTDLNTYSNHFGIPTMTQCAVSGGTYSSPCFQVVNETGGSTLPPTDGQGVNGWAGEISLDVDTVHTMCQNCNILLVEAASTSNADLIATADQKAVSMGANVVSNSWGGPEVSGEISNDSYFNHPGVPFVFSSGDNGYGVEYPAASPNVTAVGGTSLYVNTDYSYYIETAWSGAGSGCSAYESKPSFQYDAGCAKRTIADVSADADPNTGAYVVYNGSGYQFGGTSLAAPLVATIYALAGGVGSTLGNSLPYGNVNYGVNLRDVISGTNGSCSGSYLCAARMGYDGPTGLGTPFGTAAFTTGNNPPPAFNKSSPLNGATGQSTNSTLQWAAGGYHYQYCYGTSNPCSNWTDNGTSTSVSLSGLIAGQTYYWHVRAVNGAGTTYSDGSSSATWSFTTTTSAPGAFGKSSPANGATGVATVPTLQWGSSSGASYYELCWGTSNPCSTWSNISLSTSASLYGLAAGQTVYWNVRADNGSGTTYSDGSTTDWSFTVHTDASNDAFGSANVVSLPYKDITTTTAATVASDDPTFPCTSAKNYNTVWYWFTPSSSMVLTVSTLSSSYDTVLGAWTGSEGSLTSVACNDDYGGTYQSQVQFIANSGTTYYFEVASYSSGGGSLVFNVTGATIPPGTFGKSSPANGARSLSTSPTLQWGASSNASYYEYCYGTSNPCSNWTNNGISTSVSLNGLSTNTLYYWHVRAVNGGGTTYSDGNSSADWSYTTLYTVSASSSGNGTIAPSGDQTANYGDTPSFTLSPATGYHIDSVTGTCGGSLVSTTFTTNPITANCTVVANFAINTYTVSASSSGNGTIAPLGDQTANYGDTPSFILSPATGYHIDSVTGTCGGSLVSTTFTTNPITANCTVVANFAINTYTVSASSSGNGTIAPSGDQTANYGDTPSFILSPATGYHIDSVTGTCGGSLVGTTFTTNPITANCTVVANFAINTYTVSFDPNTGTGSMSPESVNYNVSTALTSNGFTKTGYTFAGWDTSSAGTSVVYTDGQSVAFTSDTDLYAVWTINSYAVTYNGNGNTGGSVPVDGLSPYYYNSTVTVLGNTGSLAKTGYSFSGWNTQSGGGGTSYSASDTFSMPANAVTLYAQWTINTYTVTFNANGGTGTMNNETENYNVATPLTTNTFTRTGYTFSGWNTAANGSGMAYANGASYPFTASVMLYAQWTINTYTISGNAGDAGVVLHYINGTAQTVTSASNGHYTFTVPYHWSGTVTPTKTGVTFTPLNRTYTSIATNQINQNYADIVSFASTAAYDGWILESAKGTGKGGSMNATATTFQLGDDSHNRQYRSILSFNTASLPDTAVIQTAVLKIKPSGSPVGTNPFTVLGTLYADIRKGYFGLGPALELADFNATATATKIGSFGATPVSGWYSATFSPTGKTDINKTSLTQLRLYFAMPTNNNNLANYMLFFSGNTPTTANQPQLIITYSLP